MDGNRALAPGLLLEVATAGLEDIGKRQLSSEEALRAPRRWRPQTRLVTGAG
jgi:hypothetical protein